MSSLILPYRPSCYSQPKMVIVFPNLSLSPDTPPSAKNGDCISQPFHIARHATVSQKSSKNFLKHS
jgi:hypothetical protein